MGQENSKVQAPTTLDLSNQFIGDLPTSFSNYSAVANLDLHHNAIESILQLSSLSHLTSLDVSENEIQFVDDVVILNNKMIRFLNCEKNKIYKISPLMGGLPLERLHMGKNNITIIPDTLGDCQQLTYLNLSLNQIVEIPPMLNNLTGLKQLILFGNKIKQIPNLSNCPLTLLNLADNEITTFPLGLNCISLQKLYLDNNNIHTIPNDISKLVTLRELTLGSNTIEELPIELTKLISLKSLDIASNDLEDFYNSNPPIDSIFDFIKQTHNQPQHTKTTITRSMQTKMERRNASIQVQKQKQKQLDVPTRKFEPAKPRRQLIRIFGENEAAWAVLINYENRDGTTKNVTFHKNDVYLFDTNKKLVVFYGKNCSKAKKQKATLLINSFKYERGLTEIETLDMSKTRRTKSEDVLRIFNTYFPITLDRSLYQAKKLINQISDNTKVFVIAIQRHGPQIILVPGRPSNNHLNSNVVVVIDTGVVVFVWCGKEASATERTVAVLKAEELLDSSMRTREKIEFVIEGAEPQIFKEYFIEWADGIEEKKILGNETNSDRDMYEEMLKELLDDLSANPVDSTTPTPYTDGILTPISDHERSSVDLSEEDILFDKLELNVISPLVDSHSNDIIKQKIVKSHKRTKSSEVFTKQKTRLTDVESQSYINKKDDRKSRKSRKLSLDTRTESFTTGNPSTSDKNKENIKVEKPHVLSYVEKSDELKKGKQINQLNDLKYEVSEVVEEILEEYIIDDDENISNERVDKKKIVSEDKENKNDMKWLDSNNEKLIMIDAKRRLVKKPKTAPSKNPMKTREELTRATPQVAPEIRTTTSNKTNVITEELLFQRRKLAKVEQGNPRDLKRLIHVKGKANPFVRLVECSWESLNSGDCFIYDPGKGAQSIYVWQGKKSNRMEKAKGLEVGKEIAKERKAKMEIIEENDEPKQFWNGLGKVVSRIKTAEEGGDDAVAELTSMKYVTLYKYWWDGLKEKVDIERWSYDGKEISKKVLEKDSCYILDCYSEMYMWCGPKIMKDRRQQYIKDCQKRYFERRKEVWIAPLYFEFPGFEQVMFKERFSDFNENANKRKQSFSDEPKKIIHGSAVDYSKMLSNEIMVRKEVYIDKGDGKKKIWRIDEFERVETLVEGEFFESESYIIQYTYVKWNCDYHILYFWQGRKCPVIDKGASARLTVDLHMKLKDEGREYRIAQNTETNHFLSIFDKMVIRLGKDPKAKLETKGKRTLETDIIPNTKQSNELMFDIRLCGTQLEYVKAVEIEKEMGHNKLDSTGVFILTSKSQAFIWKGKLSGEKQLNYAKMLINTYDDLKRSNIIEVNEGDEPNELWDVLNGKRIIKSKNNQWRNRLFEMSSKTGVFAVEEITDWYQEDLEIHAAMLVDCYDISYLWIGSKCSSIDKKFALETAIEYIKRSKEVERCNRKCMVIEQDKEPLVFTNIFHGWRVGKRQIVTIDSNMKNCEEEVLKFTQTYSYDDLVHKRFPDGIDKSILETYLSSVEFEEVFKMKREAFEELPLWKRNKIKHELKLF
ncbi:Villin [Entamoeba marina]